MRFRIAVDRHRFTGFWDWVGGWGIGRGVERSVDFLLESGWYKLGLDFFFRVAGFLLSVTRGCGLGIGDVVI
jgi:hypothetical protein